MRRFTLVELMIAVAIASLLVALAVPTLQRAQYQAKETETATNTEGLVTAEIAYMSATNQWLNCQVWAPTATVGKTKRAFTGANADCYKPLGWAPDGLIYGAYAVGYTTTDWTNGLCSCKAPNLCAMGYSDVDGDTLTRNYLAASEQNGTIGGWCTEGGATDGGGSEELPPPEVPI